MRSVLSHCSAYLLTVLLLTTPGQAASDLVLDATGGGQVRALVIGIDAYEHYRPLKGAVADARDIESALRSMGSLDVVTLIDTRADRAGVLREMEQLVARTQPNDLVLLSIAGHGAQEPERIKGSEPDGMENVFLLARFEPSATGSQQRVLGAEFNHFIKQLEEKGARVVFVADTCHGGGMVRDIDPRSEEMSFRQVPSYQLTADLLKPVTTSTEAYLTELDFNRTEFLAAVDRRTKAPEVSIPGVPGLRGALSFAVARAIEGRADADGDGKVTVKELFTNVRQVVYQLSNQRQNIITVSSPSRDPDTDVVFQYRGIKVVNVSEVRTTATPQPSKQLPPVLPGSTRPVKVAALDNNHAHFADLKPREASVEIVSPINNPDIIWDPKSRDVISWGDVVAYQIDKPDLASVIERTAAVRELKQMATKAPQVIRIGPDDSLHRNQSRVQVELADVAERAVILIDITGDGTIQVLYPVRSDAPISRTPILRFPVQVRQPFGADQMVVITSSQRMKELEQVVAQLDRRRAALQMIKMIQRYAPPDARIGSVGLFTAP
jgi:Caspase domain